MIDFLTNYGGSLAVGLIVLALVSFIIIRGVKDKRAGMSACGGDCSCCGACKYGNKEKKHKV